jgi:hypothetical protein
MRKAIIPAIAGALLAGFSTNALALETQGEIAEVDSQANIIRLENGQEFYVPWGVNRASLSLTDRVSIRYEIQNGLNVVTGYNVHDDGAFD